MLIRYPAALLTLLLLAPAPYANAQEKSAETTGSQSDVERERGMTREERIKAHHERIEKLIQTNRTKQQSQEAAAQSGSAQGTARATPIPGKPDLQIDVAAVPMHQLCSTLSIQTGKVIQSYGLILSTPINVTWDGGNVLELLDEILRQKPEWMLFKPEGEFGPIEIWDRASFTADARKRWKALSSDTGTTGSR